MIHISVSYGSSLVPYSFHILVQEICIILQTTANHRIDLKNRSIRSQEQLNQLFEVELSITLING